MESWGQNGRVRRAAAWALASTAAAFLGTAPARAEDMPQTRRAELGDHYLDESRKRPPLYQSAPITHIVPAFNTVTYALDAQLLDVTVLPESLNRNFYQQAEELHLTGYQIAPYVALSLKRVGLGFNVEGGGRKATYTRGAESAESWMTYRGIGVYGFYKLIDGKMLTTTAILGAKSLNAKHDIKVDVYDNVPQSGSYGSFRYTVNQYETGLNVQLRLLKSFSVIPWAHYRVIDQSDAVAQYQKVANNVSAMLREDLDIFWRDEPSLGYGLDFAVRFGRLEVHLGGLLGMIVDSGSDSERIEDKTYSLSFSFDHKG